MKNLDIHAQAIKNSKDRDESTLQDINRTSANIPRTSQTFFSNLKKTQTIFGKLTKKNLEIPKILKNDKNHKNNHILKLTEKELSSEYQKLTSYVSSCASKYSLEVHIAPETKEVARDEDNFWKEERLDPIVGKIFEDLDISTSTADKEGTPIHQKKRMTNLKEMWGRKSKTPILKKNQDLESLDHDNDRKHKKKGKRVRFKNLIRVVLIRKKS